MVNRKLLMNGLIKTGFTLQQGPVQTKCGGSSTGTADSIFLEKTGDLFLLTTVIFTRGSPIFPACIKLPLLLWGPCSAEHAKHA